MKVSKEYKEMVEELCSEEKEHNTKDVAIGFALEHYLDMLLNQEEGWETRHSLLIAIQQLYGVSINLPREE